MTALSDIIAKVQKLRRLATSSNANEAAAAAAAADRIIQEHALSEAQLEASGEHVAELPTEAKDPLHVFRGGRTPAWHLRLCVELARHYGCALYVEGFRYPNGRKAEEHVKIVGRSSDVEALRFMYSWLSVEVERLAQDVKVATSYWCDVCGGTPEDTSLTCGGIAPHKWRSDARRATRNARQSFRHGAVRGIANALYRSKEEARAHVSTSTALAIFDRRLEQAMAVKGSMKFDGRKRIGGTVRDETAYVRGARAGGRLVNEAATKKLGGGT